MGDDVRVKKCGNERNYFKLKSTNPREIRVNEVNFVRYVFQSTEQLNPFTKTLNTVSWHDDTSRRPSVAVAVARGAHNTGLRAPVVHPSPPRVDHPALAQHKMTSTRCALTASRRAPLIHPRPSIGGRTTQVAGLPSSIESRHALGTRRSLSTSRRTPVIYLSPSPLGTRRPAPSPSPSSEDDPAPLVIKAHVTPGRTRRHAHRKTS